MSIVVFTSGHIIDFRDFNLIDCSGFILITCRFKVENLLM